LSRNVWCTSKWRHPWYANVARLYHIRLQAMGALREQKHGAAKTELELDRNDLEGLLLF